LRALRNDKTGFGLVARYERVPGRLFHELFPS